MLTISWIVSGNRRRGRDPLRFVALLATLLLLWLFFGGETMVLNMLAGHGVVIQACWNDLGHQYIPTTTRCISTPKDNTPMKFQQNQEQNRRLKERGEEDQSRHTRRCRCTSCTRLRRTVPGESVLASPSIVVRRKTIRQRCTNLPPNSYVINGTNKKKKRRRRRKKERRDLILENEGLRLRERENQIYV